MDEIIEETKETQEELPVEETPTEEAETPKETESPEQYTEREKRYYARMKQAENEAKKWRSEADKAKKPVSDIDAILEVQEATKDLSSPEIAELKLRADALKTSLSEARRNENFVLWQKAYQEKVAKENVPLPSTTQGNVSKEKAFKDLTLEERQAFYEKTGLTTKRFTPKPAR